MLTPDPPDDEVELIPSKRFIGVFWDSENDVWRVRIETNEGTAIGESFLSEEDAARHYDECAIDLLPGIPHLNFPDD